MSHVNKSIVSSTPPQGGVSYFRENAVMVVGVGYLCVAMVARLLWGVDWVVPCLWRSVTGYLCPGCGLTTGLVRWLHGDLAGAWSSNPLVFVVAPAMVIYVAIDIYKHFRQKS